MKEKEKNLFSVDTYFISKLSNDLAKHFDIGQVQTVWIYIPSMYIDGYKPHSYINSIITLTYVTYHLVKTPKIVKIILVTNIKVEYVIKKNTTLYSIV